jgi:hypothetical protein
MTAISKCMESLSVCQRMAAQNWESANKVARQEIDEYMRSAGPGWDKRRATIDALQTEFDAKFPAEGDPALIREYLGKIDRDLRYEAEDAE